MPGSHESAGFMVSRYFQRVLKAGKQVNFDISLKFFKVTPKYYVSLNILVITKEYKMPQIINTNIASLNAQRNLNKSQSANQTALQRLSSGLRINSAKDDAAGLAISTRFNSQIRGLNVAVRNAGDGISLAQTAEGALGSMNDNLQRIRELAVQSANATNSDVDREALQSEVSQLLAEVSRTADETDFNGRKLLDGSFNATFQIGANAGQTLEVSISELTAEKLGSSATAGISAVGNDNALANGDLVINNIAIEASTASDDTSSTDNAAASAIAKVAAINRQSDDTGVSAYVDKNVSSGSEMAAVSGTATITINGADIAIATTGDEAQTRAGVVEAINAISGQTGVMAINSDSDAGGVQLVAEDGRNIQLSLDTANLSGTDYGATGTDAQRLAATNTFLSAAGLMGGLTDVDGAAANTVYSKTVTGGYTLVADPSVGSVNVAGGNGTGNGDLTNSGLVAGSYDRGEAKTVNSVTKDVTVASDLSADSGTLTNVIADRTDTATVIGAGSLIAGTILASAPDSNTVTNSEDISLRISSSSGVMADLTLTGGATLDSAIIRIDAVAGINAYERVELAITDFTAVSGGHTMYLAGATISLPEQTGAATDTQAERLEILTDGINGATYAAGVTVRAELNYAQTSISVIIDNDGLTAGTISLDMALSPNGSAGSITGNTVTAGGVGASLAGIHGSAASEASATTLVGVLAFEATSAAAVTILATEGTASVVVTGELFSGHSAEFTSYGDTALTTTEVNVANLTVDGVAQTAQTLALESNVSTIANQLNTAYADINAWEDITLTFDAGSATNLQAGDTLFIGTLTSAGTDALTSGVAVAVNDTNGDGAITISDVADAINGTDFSLQGMDISATLNAAEDGMDLNIRNFSGNAVAMVTDASGRSLKLLGGDLIGSAEQSFSGTLAYAATGSQTIDLSISDPTSSGELFTGNAVSSNFTAVNGLKDGDILINDVSIGAAEVGDDTASAEFASDGNKILSSSKELSAIAVAGAINKSSEGTGVSAEINSTVVVGGDGSAITGATPTTGEFNIGDSAEIYINGYSAGVVTLQDDGSGGIDTNRAKSDALSLVNAISGKTGTTAVDNGVSLTLMAEDGRNVSVAIDDQSGANASIGAMFGLDSSNDGIGESTFGSNPSATNNGVSAESATYQTTYGTITLKSAGEFTIASGGEGADELVSLGLREGSYGGASDGQFLTEIDISTFEGATSALTAIDNAIGAIASQRAVLGAIQNRMESTVSNLAITSENLAAANSRIQDADFAAETAELSRTQVLQQAGISILAQANQGPQQVLSLLG